MTLQYSGIAGNGSVSHAFSFLKFVGNDFNADPLNRGFNGALDDVRIYTGAADAAFILGIYNDTVLSVDDNEVSASFKSFPNPVNDRLYFSTDEVSSVEIYNLLGSKIAAQKVNNGIDMGSLSKGIYMLKLINADGKNIGTIKTLKE